MQIETIGIVGLGLMGGSLSLGLQQYSNRFRFIGLDHNPKHTQEALELGIVDEIVETLEDLKECDIIILTVPVDGIIALSQEFGVVNHMCTIIDLGSTKAKISNAIPATLRPNFVTAHPMTGTEKFGPLAAFATLYQNKVVVVCDIQMSGSHQQSIAKTLFEMLEMRVIYMDAFEHDRHAAYISHMPHALSYALANAVMKQEDVQSILALAGGGFRDMSRIAKSSPHMWEDIFRQNRTNMIEAIESFEQELKKCRIMVENQEWEKLNLWMQEANRLHDIL